MQRIRELLQWLSEQIEAMSARDRLLASILVSVLMAVVVGGVTYGVHGVLADMSSRVDAARANLADTREMAAEYRIVKAKLDAAEQRMGEFDPNQMNTYLSRWTTQAGMATSSLKIDPAGVQTVGSFQERSYKVDVADAQLEGLVRFLLALETSPYPIKVRTAEFKVDTVRGERMIDLALELVAYDKEET